MLYAIEHLILVSKFLLTVILAESNQPTGALGPNHLLDGEIFILPVLTYPCHILRQQPSQKQNALINYSYTNNRRNHIHVREINKSNLLQQLLTHNMVKLIIIFYLTYFHMSIQVSSRDYCRM